MSAMNVALQTDYSFRVDSVVPPLLPRATSEGVDLDVPDNDWPEAGERSEDGLTPDVSHGQNAASPNRDGARTSFIRSAPRSGDKFPDLSEGEEPERWRMELPKQCLSTRRSDSMSPFCSDEYEEVRSPFSIQISPLLQHVLSSSDWQSNRQSYRVFSIPEMLFHADVIVLPSARWLNLFPFSLPSIVINAHVGTLVILNDMLPRRRDGDGAVVPALGVSRIPLPPQTVVPEGIIGAPINTAIAGSTLGVPDLPMVTVTVTRKVFL